MQFKRIIAGMWTAALLSGAAALAADSGATLAALRLPSLPEVPRPQAQPLKERHSGEPRAIHVSYNPSQSVPRLRPSILDDAIPPAAAQIQLGAYRVEADATKDWNRFADSTQGLLDGLTPEIAAADLPGRGRFYRLRVGPFGDIAAADALCARLKDRGLACIPVKD